jgi:hypothetical protein
MGKCGKFWEIATFSGSWRAYSIAKESPPNRNGGAARQSAQKRSARREKPHGRFKFEVEKSDFSSARAARRDVSTCR